MTSRAKYFITNSTGQTSEIDCLKYINLAVINNLLTSAGFYPGEFKRSGALCFIESDKYKFFTISFWTTESVDLDDLPFNCKVISVQNIPSGKRTKFAVTIKSHSPDAAKSILAHVIPHATFVKIK